MATTTRRRILDSTTLTWKNEYLQNGIWSDAGTGQQTFYSRQVTTSEGHAWPKDRGVRDAGGPFDSVKLTYRNKDRADGYAGSYQYSIFPARCEGTNFPHYAWPRAERLVFGVKDVSDLDAYAWVPMSSDTLTVPGSKFIADTIPTNPMLDASVSLAELYREGLPKLLGASLLKDKTGLFRGLAGDYLSFQFGWKPVVSDLRAAAKAVMDQELILKQLERDSGRDVHRKRFLPAEVVLNSVESNNYAYPSGVQSTAFSGPAWFRSSHYAKREQWFSGAYTFHFEPDKMSEVSRIATEARHLYGLELTPEVVWNLAPWSWLVDWVTNVGDVFHNVSAFQQDGLVMRYGYVMEKNSKVVTRVNTALPASSASLSYPMSSTETFTGIRKARRKATPFGFGLLESSFTVRQWAILAALGITRAPKKLAA